LRKTLLLFTGSYPFAAAAENTFLPQEIEVLRTYFETVLVIPTSTGGGRATMSASNVVVDTAYAKFIASKFRKSTYALLGVIDPRLLRELASNLSTFLFRPRSLLRGVHAHVVATMTERWVRKLEGRVGWTECVLYTWWFDGTTLGLATFGNRANVPVITRAHGSDLYENRHDPAYIPFRSLSMERINLVFSASYAGARHLADRYPAFRDKVRTALLGIDDPGFVSSPSSDGLFRIVSCSFLVPVKRIDLMIRGLAETGRAFPQQRFRWTHIGGGDERESLVALAASSLPANVEHEFLHYPGKDGLYAFYRTEPVDVFINTSKSEGTSVAIMEAISVGIPVIATSVGGNTEIVGPDNGVLIGADPEPREIADAIGSMLGPDSGMARLRAGSRNKWRKDYSTANYAAFAKSIREL
jgi:glycosyltransferase involved in cell wall biosynthesis